MFVTICIHHYSYFAPSSPSLVLPLRALAFTSYTNMHISYTSFIIFHRMVLELPFRHLLSQLGQDLLTCVFCAKLFAAGPYCHSSRDDISTIPMALINLWDWLGCFVRYNGCCFFFLPCIHGRALDQSGYTIFQIHRNVFTFAPDKWKLSMKCVEPSNDTTIYVYNQFIHLEFLESLFIFIFLLSMFNRGVFSYLFLYIMYGFIMLEPSACIYMSK